MTTQVDTAMSIPLHAEELSVELRHVAKQHVRVDTTTVLDEAHIDEMLRHNHASIETVAVGRIVPEMPITRQVGDVMIIPVVEEIAVVEKRLFLKEEIHIRLVETTHRHQETVTLRRQHAVLSREPAVSETSAGGETGAPS
jgi:stress response protein YsnF